MGVTDGFDSINPQSKMMLTLLAMLHELFIDNLRSKVDRGMKDAFRQGKLVGDLCLGYRLVVVRDEQGQPMQRRNGGNLQRLEIYEVEAESERLAFVMYAEKGSSTRKIANYFNLHRVGGSNRWDSSGIVQILTREAYVGREVWGKTRNFIDPISGARRTEKCPPETWPRRNSPELRIVSDALWDKAQARLAKARLAFKRGEKPKLARSEVYPKSLVRPACGYCKRELHLGRSGKYSSFCCPNGVHGKLDCKLKSYKAVSIVEKAVLAKVFELLLADSFVAEVVEAANKFLLAESKRPRANDRPIRAEICRLEKAVQRLLEAVEEGGAGTPIAAMQRLAEHEARIKELKAQLTEIDASKRPVPPPLKLDDVKRLMGDLHGLLRDDVARAAPLLRELLGPIVVRQTDEQINKGVAWTGEFRINSVPVLARLAAEKGCPSTSTMEFLQSRRWTTGETVTIALKTAGKPEQLAAQIDAWTEKGTSINLAAGALRVSWETANRAKAYYQTGVTPKTRKKEPLKGHLRKPPRAAEIAAEVQRMRDTNKWPFTKIAAHFGVSHGTVTRAYDHAKGQAALVHAASTGSKVERGRYLRSEAGTTRRDSRR